jgi:hypothetical protein
VLILSTTFEQVKEDEIEAVRSIASVDGAENYFSDRLLGQIHRF